MHTTATKSTAQADTAQLEGAGKKMAVTPTPQQIPLWANAAVPVIQFSLKINNPNDKYEQEANRVAEQVMRMPEPTVQRKACACGRPAGPDGMCEDCKQKHLSIQRKVLEAGAQTAAPPLVHQTLHQPGRPLDRPTRNFMKNRFGGNFDSVRVHTNSQAAASAESVNARAYVVGRNIVFGLGQYRPETSAGRRLLAHELAHVVQQGGGELQRGQRPAQGMVTHGNAPPEREAERMGASGTYGMGIGVPEAHLDETVEHGFGQAEVTRRSAGVRGNSEKVPLNFLSIHTRQQKGVLQRRPLEGLLDESIHDDVAHSIDDTTLVDSIDHLHRQLAQTDDASVREGITGNLAVLEAEAARRQGWSGPPREDPSEPGLGGIEIGDYGIAYKTEGVNLRDKPGSSPDSKVLGRVAFNTRMYVHSLTDGHYLVGTDDGRLGYVAVSHVKTGLPEPDAKIYHIQPGDTALSISRKHYGGEAEWGADHRFFVNGLVYVNRGPGERGIEKPDPKADWDTTAVRAGYMIWVPSLAFMRSLKSVVGSGSVTYEVWQTVKRAGVAVGEFLLGAGAFTVGLLHGALESVWDILVGLKDLLVLAYDLIKWLIGLLAGDSKGLFDSLKEANWGELVQGWIDDFLAKWNQDSILKRWHFRGWVIGYVIAEVLMLFFSGGVIQGIKWIGKSAKVAKVVAQIPKVAKLGEAAKSSKLGQRFSKALSATKGGTMSARAATAFVTNLLKKPASIWNKGPDEIADALQKAGYKVTVTQSEKGSKLSKQIRIVETPSGAPPITRIQVHPGGGRHGGSYYKISSSDPSFGTKWIADKATFKLLPGMDASKVVWVEAKLEGWLLRAVAANAAAQRAGREAAE